ncbi:HEAT repeat domain-containing protein [Pontiella agarivorans]|uniref:HEAT repeat domain-containing protein n=1 Tax=Pontiella agarivorans TaxID=3038953 RepID=A0ABU5MT53_9BACT|nr:HEAT repeat domain-containing protein [Pontiella agarivorans]MDZ8117394.1 HEAT repeat domain-containing protein [Pontiella agarivorans]
MDSNMDLKQHQEARQRAVALGRSQDPAALPELVQLLKTPSADVQRLAASAIGKLSGFGADGSMAVEALAPVALHDPHPQTRQYALKALKTYGAYAEAWLDELDDLAARPNRKDYIPVAAAAAARTIREAVQHREQQKERCCLKCGQRVAFDEFERSMRLFQRIYCDKCFDETCVKRRNWETGVEEKKNIKTVDGTLVQSSGEKKIADWLAKAGLDYRYDGRLRILEGFQIRPDFYLPQFDVYIEYWGMDTPRYKAGMYLKQDLYQKTGKKLISLYPADQPDLDGTLGKKLKQFGWNPARQDRSI